MIPEEKRSLTEAGGSTLFEVGRIGDSLLVMTCCLSVGSSSGGYTACRIREVWQGHGKCYGWYGLMWHDSW
jgi:hypothetical protein